MNTPGRSLYVRLHGPDCGPGAAGKWTDAATGEHGDLLDLITRNRDLWRLGDAMDEARSFLALPRPPEPVAREPAQGGSPDAARNLFRAGRPVPGTLAETYLRARAITTPLDWPALRYHPSVFYREVLDAPLERWPALLGAVTDLGGHITGIQRTWLDPRRPAKAPIADPRRALGHLLGNGVRLGIATDILAAGEGLETMLAQIRAASLADDRRALRQPSRRSPLPPTLCRLYIARDNDAAGRKAADRLHERGHAAGIETSDLVPVYEDFNVDLCRLGATGLLAHLAGQLVPFDRGRFLPSELAADPTRSA